MDINLCVQFTNLGLAGENTVTDSDLVWISKTHWPMESPGGALNFKAEKTISIVRNPIDQMVSLISLVTTSSHSLAPEVPFHEGNPNYF